MNKRDTIDVEQLTENLRYHPADMTIRIGGDLNALIVAQLFAPWEQSQLLARIWLNAPDLMERVREFISETSKTPEFLDSIIYHAMGDEFKTMREALERCEPEPELVDPIEVLREYRAGGITATGKQHREWLAKVDAAIKYADRKAGR